LEPTPRNRFVFSLYLVQKRSSPGLFFPSNKCIEGSFHKYVITEGEAICVPANMIHVVETIGLSIVFAFNYIHVDTLLSAADVYKQERQENLDYDHCYPNYLYLSLAYLHSSNPVTPSEELDYVMVWDSVIYPRGPKTTIEDVETTVLASATIVDHVSTIAAEMFSFHQ
jgi:hypothetical protein